jgi:hypothetical protein
MAKGWKHTLETKMQMSLSRKGKLYPHKKDCTCYVCLSKRNEPTRLGKIVAKDFLIKKYVNENIPASRLAKQVGCDSSVIKYYLEKYRLPVRGKYGPNKGKKFSKEYRQKISVGQLGNKRTAETKKKQSLSMVGKKWSEEHKAKISLAKKGIPRSHEAIRKSLLNGAQRPNKFEIRGMSYLNTIYPGKFQYTGSGTLIINHRSADAYSKELNMVAQFNGIYWHLKKYGFANTEQAKGAIELIEAIPFLEAGYKVLFIWEDELKDNNPNIEKLYHKEALCAESM